MSRPPAAVRSIFTIVLGATLAFADRAGAQRPGTPAPRPAPRLRRADSSITQILRLRDGSVLVGRVIALDSTSARFQMRVGTLEIPRDEIEGIQEVGRLVRAATGELWLPDPNATRLMFAPTGRQLKEGEGYFSDYLLFFPGFAYGISDQLTIGGGMSIFPTGLDDQLFYLTPKVGVVQTERVNVAVGALVIAVPSELGDDDGLRHNTAGMLYSVGTFGRPEASFTAGLGYGFQNGRLADSPAFVLGGVARGTRRVALVTENYLLPNWSLISGGMRFMGEKLAVDLGIFAMSSDGHLDGPYPFIGFVANF